MKITRHEEAPVRYMRRHLCATKELQTESGTAHYFVPNTFEYLGSISRSIVVGGNAPCYRVHDVHGTCFAEVTLNIGSALDYFAKADVDDEEN